MNTTPQPSLYDPATLAALIDHTILKPEVTSADVERLCREALAHKFAAVCINPVFVSTAAELLRGSVVRVCAVVGFPLGASLTSTKLAEAQSTLRDGAQELDMVINIGALKSAQNETVSADIRAITAAAHAASAICKVIIETCLLTEEEKVRACRLAAIANADFRKNLHRLQRQRSHPGRRSADAHGSRSPHRSKSQRRHSHPGRSAENDRRRRHPHRHQQRPKNPGRSPHQPAPVAAAFRGGRL